ncbi:hypothetical protein JW935_08645 [candidate division KSB1 bacterium]|nr:hypothetical protein [candidate division KSB1 bacterium]
MINKETAIDTANFPHTGTWTNWTISDSVDVFLEAGDNMIRIEAYNPDGTANYDYIVFLGTGITPADCTPSYTLTVDQNFPEGGIISYTPVKDYYDEGTLVTLAAQSAPGYFFQSWSGDVTSVNPVFTFWITRNINATALFLPNGTAMDSSFIGYATIQDDQGTPYLVIGGALGDTVSAMTYADLKN